MEYGDMWDIMGSGEYRVRTKFGLAGPGFNAIHLKQMDCIAPDRIWTANPNPGSHTITLAALNRFDANGFLMATIPPAPQSASKYSYVVEFRRKTGWDAGIPQDTLLIHELHRLGGYAGTDAADYDNIIPACGTTRPGRTRTIFLPAR